MFHEHKQCKRHWFTTTTTTTKAKKKNRGVKTRKAANQTDKGQQNTIKPNPLSSLTFLKRHRLTLFQCYHPCQKSKFSHQLLPKKKKKKKFPSSHQHPSLYTVSQKKKVSRFMQSVFHRLVAEKQENHRNFGFNFYIYIYIF